MDEKAEAKGQVVRYQAQDGTEVALSPQIVMRDILAPNADISDRQMASFIATCQARHLNPLAGDCYLTVFKGRASVITSKGYFMRVAAAQPTYDGMRAGVIVATKEGLVYREGSLVGGKTERLVGGWAEVFDKSRSHPSRAEVALSEYDQGNTMWESKPATMIRKVAVVQALREAYPNAFEGVYDRAEMPVEYETDN